MPLSTSTLNALQKVGAAAFAADEKLKKNVERYAERVHAALTKNPYDLGNDTLIENWKVAARLSHTLAGIEEELKKVHQVASQLIDDDQPTVSEVPALAAPTRSVGKKVTNKAASVKVKMEKKSVKLANKIRRPKVAGTSRESAARGSNPAKLFAYFERTLSPTEFSAVSQTVVAKETDIPLGSMTAAIKKLIETGRVTAAPNGSLKLVQSESPVQP